jgi:hypothetical protein
MRQHPSRERLPLPPELDVVVEKGELRLVQELRRKERDADWLGWLAVVKLVSSIANAEVVAETMTRVVVGEAPHVWFAKEQTPPNLARRTFSSKRPVACGLSRKQPGLARQFCNAS